MAVGTRAGTTVSFAEFEMWAAAAREYSWNSRCGASIAAIPAMVKRERLKFLADSPGYAKRFIIEVGRRCHSGRSGT